MLCDDAYGRERVSDILHSKDGGQNSESKGYYFNVDGTESLGTVL